MFSRQMKPFVLRNSNMYLTKLKIKVKTTHNSVRCTSSRSFIKQKPIDRRVFLEFFEIHTFDDDEIFNSYRKFALNNVHLNQNLQNKQLQIPTRDEFEKNLRQILENAHTEKLMPHTIPNSNVDSLTVGKMGNIPFISVDEIMQHFPPNSDPTNISGDKNTRLPPSSNEERPPLSNTSTVPAINTAPLRRNNVRVPTELIDYDYYRSTLLSIGNKLDDRIYAVTFSFLLTGASIGMIIPCMPFLVKELALSSSDFGMIITSFGAAKLMANIPAGYYVEILGRKKMLVYGLGMCAIGIGGIGVTLSPLVWPLPTLMACRFITGLGVSIFTTGAFMIVSDVSTALNRTRTMAPIMTGFQAGIALGPAVGGIAIESLGIPLTYVSCGVMFTVIAIANHYLMQETMRVKTTSMTPKQHSKSEKVSSVFNSFFSTLSAWKHLGTTNLPLRRVCELNMFYWFSLAGVQMTILPLYMVSPVFNLNPTQIGTTFALMSIFSILSSQPSAYLADNLIGKIPSVIVGGTLVFSSFALLPFAHSHAQLLCMLVPLSVGSTILQSVPAAYVSDITPADSRSSSLSLFRTAGDVGLLFGASLTGVVSVLTSFEFAIEANAAVMLTSIIYFSCCSLTRRKSSNKPFDP